jgi:hypothetical protein
VVKFKKYSSLQEIQVFSSEQVLQILLQGKHYFSDLKYPIKQLQDLSDLKLAFSMQEKQFE